MNPMAWNRAILTEVFWGVVLAAIIAMVFAGALCLSAGCHLHVHIGGTADGQPTGFFEVIEDGKSDEDTEREKDVSRHDRLGRPRDAVVARNG